MIPQRVKLRGFLCYKEEQCIEFDGNATLWMLSGLNGSGKSAIFDAVTFALFGHHRGGGQHNHELINKDSDSLVVEFDFLLDGKLFRAKRTLKRDTKGGARGTQQVFRHEEGTWTPVQDTGQKREFDAWVSENIGLQYDTFTSSVLLLQGKAERLLDSKPEGRREVLASIVDLGRYERLHQKADERRKNLDGQLKTLMQRLAALPAVAPLEVQEARNHIEEADAARTQARESVERLVSIKQLAKSFQDLQGRSKQAQARLQKARQVLGEASAIEQAVERLRELREVVPRLHEITCLRGQAHQAGEKSRNWQREREKLAEQLAQKEHAQKLARDRRAALNAQITRDDKKLREIASELRQSEKHLSALHTCEHQEMDLARLREELTRFPADTMAPVLTAREAFERLDALDRRAPILVRFSSRRTELSKAMAQLTANETQLQKIRARGESAKIECDGLRTRHEEAARQLAEANEQATEARTLLLQAREALQEVQTLDGAKTCRHCGQPLTAGHLDEEKRRRGQAVKAAEIRARQTTAAQESARKAEQELREQLDRIQKTYNEARIEYGEHNSALKGARTTVEKLQQECTHIWHELPPDYRGRICQEPAEDWLETVYPTEKDLEGLRVQLRELEPARKKLREAESAQQRHAQLKAKEASMQETITRLLRDIPADREQIRRTHTEREALQSALFGSLDAARQQMTEAEKDEDRLNRERERARVELARAEGSLKEEQLTQQNADRGVTAQLKQLPATWQAQAETCGIRELHTLRGEQKHLEDEMTDERGRELEYARHHVLVMEQDARQLEQQEAAMPPEAREDLAQLEGRLESARRIDQECDAKLSTARQRLALLESYQQQRQQLDEEYRAREKEQLTHKTLADLLGRERLQLFLVRQAERQVVEYANEVLDRLSGGQLYLRLSGEANGEGASAKALDLEAYNRSTGERPINVAFLSGSQKFRVAVSLALGIGQYASRRHRPIESVIIDEGFGCLDSQGRQVMIQELQNLRSQMRCILLVSHQEDFADAFNDGYQFRLENGATRVERYRK